MPEDEPGIAHMVPDVISKVLSGQQPLQIFGDGTQTRTLTHIDDIADGIVTAMASPAGLNEDFNISASEELTVAEIARIIWEACGRDPAAFELEHLPTFEVDVVRRWPCVEKAGECSAGRRRSASARASRRPSSGCASGSPRASDRGVPGDKRVRLYALAPEPIDELCRWLEQLSQAWQGQLDAFKDYVEVRQERPEGRPR